MDPEDTSETIAPIASGGVSVRVERFAPARPAPWPAVVLLHGAEGLRAEGLRAEGLAQGGTRMAGGYRVAARTLAAAGFLVLLPHYLDRTGETRAAFSRIGANVPLWAAALADVLDHVAADPRVDAARIGLVGVSLGAALALDLASTDPRVAALVDCFGFLPPGLPERKGLRLPPTLVLHGARDAIVPVVNAHALEALLLRLGVPHEVRIYPDQAHGFTGGAEADAALRTAAFLRLHLAAAR